MFLLFRPMREKYVLSVQTEVRLSIPAHRDVVKQFYANCVSICQKFGLQEGKSERESIEGESVNYEYADDKNKGFHLKAPLGVTQKFSDISYTERSQRQILA